MNKPTPDVALRHSSLNRHGTSTDLVPVARQIDKALRILRMKQLIERTNLSRATLYVLMSSDSTFPKKIKLTARSIGFLESEVDAWIAARADSRNAA
ncbi:helix-turn-helix transcriptional regulator [Burkholderia sp. B21-007]|uniref:helix-turn-helix transcriptional regulator n=1 Tax=Burkholderia sp. B21-007 TaxID=2890407 RepID=UPI001E3BD2A7|nr:AlpA family transcriptional regulator [Burkholderia sp. B21-007]UEP27992.1 AlpA family transcriptional regulator [Burkholderia sp. B21-007]